MSALIGFKKKRKNWRETQVLSSLSLQVKIKCSKLPYSPHSHRSSSFIPYLCKWEVYLSCLDFKLNFYWCFDSCSTPLQVVWDEFEENISRLLSLYHFWHFSFLFNFASYHLIRIYDVILWSLYLRGPCYSVCFLITS